MFGFLKKIVNETNSTSNEAAVPQSRAPQAGILNLQKNDILDLTKTNPSLNNMIVGAGWDVSTRGADIDLDLAALLLNSDGKLIGKKGLVYFGSKKSQGIYLTGDNLTGEGEGDDERIIVSLPNIPTECTKVVFTVVIYGAKMRRQTFGMVRNSYVRLLDADNREREICRFNLMENGGDNTGIIFAELFREGSNWNFKAVGELLKTTIGDLEKEYK
ncbi:TerD family protein [Clostridium sp.]|uniref:TerD family protein n=1 Tax=Clostridium sp. TaxID=1506 RepID=UPI002FC9C9FD